MENGNNCRLWVTVTSVRGRGPTATSEVDLSEGSQFLEIIEEYLSAPL